MTALQGLVIVDASVGLAGAMATGQLADHGATVIRVDPLGSPPPSASAEWTAFHRGKRRISIDLGDERGAAVLHALLGGADVFVRTERADAERLSLDEVQVRRRYPGMIHCVISADRAMSAGDLDADDLLVMARLGVVNDLNGSATGPISSGIPFASIGAALLGVIGVLSAVAARARDGLGRFVETSLADGVLAFGSMFWQRSETPTPDVRIPNPSSRGLAVLAQCSDGEFLTLNTAASGAHRRLMEALGLDGRIQPAKGPVELAEPLTAGESEIIRTELPRILRSRTREEWLGRLFGADVACAPVSRPGQFFDEEQVRINDMVATVEDAVLGRVDQVGVPAKLSWTPGRPGARSAAAGEHTNELLAESGYAPSVIEELRVAGVVR